MFKKKEELTRLGDVLVDKGIISKAQLDIAIQEQSRRKKLLDPSDSTAKVTPIGEILIELGFIDQLQLKRGLNWQQRLRHVSIAMALCAPFMMLVPNVARAAPITIEAENYSTMKGVITGNSSDVGGGLNVGSINTGDWMTYNNIAIPVSGTYKITYRVASPSTGGAFQLKTGAGTLIDTVTVPKTSTTQVWVDVARTVTLTAGTQNLTLLGTSGGFNLTWFKIENTAGAVIPSSSASSVASSVPSSAASSSTAAFNPVTIQAENYSAMSGVWNESTSDVGGGQDTGNINTGDWMDYKNMEVVIPATAKYKITYRVASLSAGGSFSFHEAGGSALFDTVPVPVTGGWQTWTNVERVVTLPAGKHYFGVKALLGGFNLNWIKVESVDQSIPVTPGGSSASASSTPAVSSSSSSKAAVSSSSSSKPAVSSSSSWSSSSAPNAEHVAGPVGISWTAPDKRENGDYLDITDVGGYEIRYKKAVDTKYTYVTINDAFQNRYDFAYLDGDYVFQIAAFDKNGVYSSFVDIRRQ